jgi:hypothetical protein
MRCLLPLIAMMGAAPLTATLAAQPTQPLRGTVFDSVRAAPLADATVRVIGAPAFAKTDEKGRFRFDSVALGQLELAVEHPLLDSIGLYELTARVDHDGKREHKLGVPSFATMWRAICGRPAPSDSGLLYGTVTNAESQAARQATVTVAWLEAYRDGDGKLGQRRISYETRTDSLGRFTACGLPTDEPFTLKARGDAADSLSRIELPLPPRSSRVLRQDVMLGADIIADGPASNAPMGVVRGTVMGLDGAPVAGTRVAIVGLPDVRSDSAGRFFLRDIPTGSREIEALAVGRTPQSMLVTVRQRDTAVVNFTLDRVTTLANVRTEATVLVEFTRAFEERKKSGLGRFRDSLEVERTPSMVAALSAFPNVSARTGSGGVPIVRLPKPPGITNGASQCIARLYVDGRPDIWERVASMLPRDVAWIEVYARPAQMPAEYQIPTNGDACGVVAIATKAYVAR